MRLSHFSARIAALNIDEIPQSDVEEEDEEEDFTVDSDVLKKLKAAQTRRAAEEEEITGYDVDFPWNRDYDKSRPDPPKFKLDAQGKATVTAPAILAALGKHGSIFHVPDKKTTGKLSIQVNHDDWEPEFANAQAEIFTVSALDSVKVNETKVKVDGELEIYGHGSGGGAVKAPPAVLFKGTYTFKPVK